MAHYRYLAVCVAIVMTIISDSGLIDDSINNNFHSIKIIFLIGRHFSRSNKMLAMLINRFTVLWKLFSSSQLDRRTVKMAPCTL